MSKAQNDSDRERVLAEVKRICDSYVRNRAKLDELRTETIRLKKLKADFSEESSKNLVEQRISEIAEESIAYEKDTSFFETMLTKLKERAFFVMFQLYAEGISWDFVKDPKGQIMSRDSISRERKKALSFMADNYDKFDWK